MTTVVSNQTQTPSSSSATAGGDDIGLSITVSESASIDQENNNNADSTLPINGQVTAIPSFIPPSVEASPIPSEDEIESEFEHEHEQSTFAAVSSIMRENIKKASQNQNNNHQPDQSQTKNQVAALEDRVRDLEEKLSTLSMLLMQQNQHQRQQSQSQSQSSRTSLPRTSLRCPSSPECESSACDSVSSINQLSPPSTPFRSLASFATIPSSNTPVLESPTPVSNRYRDRNGIGFHNTSTNTNTPDRSFGDCSVPYEQRSWNRNNTNNSNSPSKRGHRGLQHNLSYQILHAPDSELDLRSFERDNTNDGGSNRSRNRGEPDAGSENTSRNENSNENSHHDLYNNPTMGTIQSNESFEQACRVPTLDSLPGSSRTSPIESKDPTVNGVLSPETLKAAKGGTGAEAMTMASTPCLDKSPSSDRDVSLIRDASATKASMSMNMSISTSSIMSDSSAAVPKHQKKRSNIKSKWLAYLNSVQESNYDTDKQMEEFVKVPSAVEALLSFGFWISVDSFLYTLTILPLRSVYSIFLLAVWVYSKISGREAAMIPPFHRHNSYHLIQVSIMYIIYVYVLKPINISILYHWIRVQSMVKLYLLVAMIEVFDRLLCSLGQDCLDSLYWNTTRRPRSSRLIVSALVVLLYTALHSFLLFVHVATMNVAMNSDDQALLSLLIGGNFAEIKSTVFKKYNKATLFKITASDICERFKLALFLFLVLMLNASQGMDTKMVYNYLSMCGIVWCAEWLSDWLKHSFITKFNYIASGVYGEYSLLLAGDLSGFGHEGENLDKSHAVVKRLGLAQIPLVCVMTKYLKEAYKYQTYGNQPRAWVLWVGGVSVWLLLLVTKVTLASILERISRNKLEAAPEFSKTNTTVAKKRN